MVHARAKAFAARYAAEAIKESLPTERDLAGEEFTAEDRRGVYAELQRLANSLLAEAERLDAI